MKKVIIDQERIDINLEDVSSGTPIFVKKDNKFIGMVIQEVFGKHKDKWIIKTGGQLGATGHYGSRGDCLNSGLIHEYSYFIDLID